MKPSRVPTIHQSTRSRSHPKSLTDIEKDSLDLHLGHFVPSTFLFERYMDRDFFFPRVPCINVLCIRNGILRSSRCQLRRFTEGLKLDQRGLCCDYSESWRSGVTSVSASEYCVWLSPAVCQPDSSAGYLTGDRVISGPKGCGCGCPSPPH